MDKFEISIVVIGKNEILHIRKCLQAVIDAVVGMDAEIVYVDSGSTDGTVKAACEYDITVLQLRPEQPPSPAAGRYIGTLHTQHKFILFIDGDALVSRAWLLKALEYIAIHPETGAVGGPIRILRESVDGKIVRQVLIGLDQDFVEVNTLSGPIGLYRRQALDEAGHWNPYLRAQEEWELDERVQKAGFNLVKLSTLSGDHFVPIARILSEFLRLRKRGFFDSYGQIFRLCGSWQRMWRFFTESLLKAAIFVVFVLALVASAVTGGIRGGGIWWLVGPLAFLSIAEVYFTVRTKSLFGLLVFIIVQFYVLWRMPVAFFKYKPGKISDYPINPIVIQKAAIAEEGAK